MTWNERRACWAMSIIGWALRELVPASHRREIYHWAKEYGAYLLRNYERIHARAEGTRRPEEG